MTTFTERDTAAPVCTADPSVARVSRSSLPVELQLRLFRSLPNPRDRSLSQLARAWFERMPVADRPVSLFERFPRVANRIALCWDDKQLSERLFNELLSDRRGGGRGFPAAIKGELLALREAADFDVVAAAQPPQPTAVGETKVA